MQVAPGTAPGVDHTPVRLRCTYPILHHRDHTCDRLGLVIEREAVPAILEPTAAPAPPHSPPGQGTRVHERHKACSGVTKHRSAWVSDTHTRAGEGVYGDRGSISIRSRPRSMTRSRIRNQRLLTCQ